MIKDNGGQAFPTGGMSDGKTVIWRNGMTLREYACIHLRVPETDHDWLNELIRKSQRDEFAAKAIQGLLSDPNCDYEVWSEFAGRAYKAADAMLKAREQ